MAININGTVTPATSPERAFAAVNARLDTIIADGQQTSGNTELIDIRTGDDNVTYDTAGEAVRTQFSNVKSDISTINTTVSGNTSDISALSTRVDSAENDIITINTTIGDHDVSIANLGNQVESIHDDVDTLTTKVSGNSDNIIILDTRMESAEGDITTIKSDISDIETSLTSLNKANINHNTCSIFKKVCFCGDNLMAGESWVYFLRHITGGEYVNCAVSNTNAKTWLANDNGLEKLKASGRAQAYIIAFGVNDSDTTGDYYLPLGISIDIGTNENSYYAKMSKIVTECYAINNSADIFLFTCPDGENGTYNPERYDGYNQAVRDIATYYADKAPNVFCIDLAANKDMFVNDTSLTSDRVNGTYSALGYQQIAQIIGNLWSAYINSNVNNFRNVNTIPYDSSEEPLYNFSVAQGDTWVETLEIKNADGTEHQYDSSEIVRFALSTSRSANDVIITQILEYDTINHEYVIILSAAETATLTADAIYYFDIGLQSGTTYTRLIECQELKVIPGISRAVTT